MKRTRDSPISIRIICFSNVTVNNTNIKSSYKIDSIRSECCIKEGQVI